MLTSAQRDSAIRLLRDIGLGGDVTFESLEGGGNNRVYKATTPKGAAALKVYFHHAKDMRDRLGTEFAFSQVAWDGGIRCIPQPLAMDASEHLGLYEFVAGRRLIAEEVDATRLGEAEAFFAALNREMLTGAGQLGPGSEACFSFTAHLITVGRRLARLQTATEHNAALAIFLKDDALPLWQAIEESVLDRAEHELGLDVEAEIIPAERCLSPSDFGFHNALLDSSGRLRFHDFEYAGWDDPAKFVGDFFNQVSVPAPRSLYRDFVAKVAAHFPEPARNTRRFDLLLPVYAMKWITIMLNVFLPDGGSRRRFAGAAIEDQMEHQLQLARQALEELRNGTGAPGVRVFG